MLDHSPEWWFVAVAVPDDRWRDATAEELGKFKACSVQAEVLDMIVMLDVQIGEVRQTPSEMTGGHIEHASEVPGENKR